MIHRFRKKPIVVEAMQWHGSYNSWQEIQRWMGQSLAVDFTREGEPLTIPTLEGFLTAKTGDWIIRGVKGEFYPCADEILRQTYEEVSNEENIKLAWRDAGKFIKSIHRTGGCVGQ